LNVEMRIGTIFDTDDIVGEVSIAGSK
jgi:hypothetical protein